MSDTDGGKATSAGECGYGGKGRIIRLPPPLKPVPIWTPYDHPFYRVARIVLPLTLAQLFRFEAAGTEHLPAQGPAILAVNHRSYFDPIFVGMAFPRPLRYMAKVELWRPPLLPRLIEALGAFPVERGAGDRSALEASLDLLAAGEVLMMFPEGTRQRGGGIGPFQPGVAMLALRSGAPVIPVAMKGTEAILAGGRPRLSVVRLLAGEPVDLGGLEGRKSEMYRAAAERIREKVVALYERLGRS